MYQRGGAEQTAHATLAAFPSSDDMLRITRESGWYDYFDTITVVGESCEFPNHLEQLIAA